MVPHRRILQAVALVAMARADGPKHAEALEQTLSVRFPCALADFTTVEVQGRLPAALDAWFCTTDMASTMDYRPLMRAAAFLQVSDLVVVGANGPTIVLPAGVRRIRDNEAMVRMVETSLLCNVSLETVCSDLRQMFGCSLDESDLRRYGELFADREYVEGESWTNYMRCIGNDEALFRRALIGQPKDFIRWRLGVPVALNAESVLNRLMSDAYYTERLLKSSSGNMGLNMTKDEMARVKLERDTIFKALAMRNDMREAAGGDSAKTAMATLSAVVAKYESQDDLLSRDELALISDG
jgi:hypothetical protein